MPVKKVTLNDEKAGTEGIERGSKARVRFVTAGSWRKNVEPNLAMYFW